MNDTTGKPPAVVTGASSGIGRELAARFAEHGYDLVVAAEDERIESTAASLAGQAVQALPVRADLAAFDGVEELWQRIQGTGRIPEAVAINAGVGVARDFTRDNDLADELRLIGLNITGAVHLARRVLPEMAAGRGGVLFTSSIAATAPGPYHATYAASKAFLLSFAEALRYELPGPTDTEFFDRAGMQGTKLREETATDDPAEVAREGFEALMAGKDHVVAGSMKNKAQVAAGRIMPETAKAATQARQTEPGSGG
jgi:short-subunit dehydrogenase